MAKFFLNFLLLFWELPQNLLGALLYIAQKKRHRVYKIEMHNGRFIINSDVGVSLGRFVFWTIDENNKVFDLPRENKMHEYGHSEQSRMLGPLYLVIVGVPSSLRALYARVYFRRRGSKWQHYYDGFPENWADKLAAKESGCDFTRAVEKQ